MMKDIIKNIIRKQQASFLLILFLLLIVPLSSAQLPTGYIPLPDGNEIIVDNDNNNHIVLANPDEFMIVSDNTGNIEYRRKIDVSGFPIEEEGSDITDNAILYWDKHVKVYLGDGGQVYDPDIADFIQVGDIAKVGKGVGLQAWGLVKSIPSAMHFGWDFANSFLSVEATGHFTQQHMMWVPSVLENPKATIIDPIVESYNRDPAEFVGRRAFDAFLLLAPFAKGRVAEISLAARTPITDPRRMLPAPGASTFEQKIPVLYRYVDYNTITDYNVKGYIYHPDPTKRLYFTLPRQRIAKFYIPPTPARPYTKGPFYKEVVTLSPELASRELALPSSGGPRIFVIEVPTKNIRHLPTAIENVIDLKTGRLTGGLEISFPPGTKISFEPGIPIVTTLSPTQPPFPSMFEIDDLSDYR